MIEFVKDRYEAARLLVLGVFALLPARVTSTRAAVDMVYVIMGIAALALLIGGFVVFAQGWLSDINQKTNTCIGNPAACGQ